jgi:hypothetical protein
VPNPRRRCPQDPHSPAAHNACAYPRPHAQRPLPIHAKAPVVPNASPPEGRIVAHERQEALVLAAQSQTKPPIISLLAPRIARRRRAYPEAALPARPAQPRGPHRQNHPEPACATPLSIHAKAPVAPNASPLEGRIVAHERQEALVRTAHAKPHRASSPSSRRASPAGAVPNPTLTSPKDPHSPATHTA